MKESSSDIISDIRGASRLGSKNDHYKALGGFEMANVPSVILAMIMGAIIVLIALYSHAYFNERKTYIYLWLLGWGLYLLVYLTRFGELIYQQAEFFLIADQTLYVLGNYLIFQGFFKYIEKPLPKLLNYAVGVLLFVIVLGIHLKMPLIRQKVPNILSVTGLYLWAGFQLIRYTSNTKLLNRFLGASLIGWGLSIGVFLFLRTQTEILVGQLVCSSLALIVVFVSLQCHFQRIRQYPSQSKDKIDYLGMYDVLTGLYSRNYFERYIRELNQEANLPLSVIVGDMNGLKLVNDTFGHIEGDNLLKEMAGVLSKTCRTTDLIVRWGGDEFVIILLKTDVDRTWQIAERIKKAALDIESTSIPLSISLGAATLTDRKKTLEQVFKEAEKLMYSKKLIEGKDARKKIISGLGKLLVEKNYESRAHVESVQDLALKLGNRLGLSNHELNNLASIAALHDIGKIVIPQNIIHKSEGLTLDEWEIMKRHTEIGYRFALSIDELTSTAEGILGHHEWWNGEGYPQGLKGKEIPLSARIISIADAYDVMIQGSTYKPSLTEQEALQELRRCAGLQFDPWLVDEFLKMMETEPIV